jgi:hypothetical protein
MATTWLTEDCRLSLYLCAEGTAESRTPALFPKECSLYSLYNHTTVYGFWPESLLCPYKITFCNENVRWKVSNLLVFRQQLSSAKASPSSHKGCRLPGLTLINGVQFWSPALSTSKPNLSKSLLTWLFWLHFMFLDFNQVVSVHQSTKSRPRPPSKTHFFYDTENEPNWWQLFPERP